MTNGYNSGVYQCHAEQSELLALAAYARAQNERLRAGAQAPASETYDCDYSLHQRTADYSKWGMRA